MDKKYDLEDRLVKFACLCLKALKQLKRIKQVVNRCQTSLFLIFTFLFLISMTITLLVAAAENNAIGKNNQLLWSLPNDMKFFKNTAWGMAVIMGRKTYES